MNEDILRKFKKLEEEIKRHYKSYDACEEDFDVMDASGGNFDDAYQLGIDEGYRCLAAELMTILEQKD